MIQSGLSHYLFDAIERGASDLHVTVGLPPMVRVKGEVRPLDYLPLTPNATRELIYDILSIDQRQRPENEWELDFSYSLPRTARFRVNVYFRGVLWVPLSVRFPTRSRASPSSICRSPSRK